MARRSLWIGAVIGLAIAIALCRGDDRRRAAPSQAHREDRTLPRGAARGTAAAEDRGAAWLDRDVDGDRRLEGRVIDAEGRAVAGAVVMIDVAPPRTTHTAPDGSFVFTELTPRAYVVTASAG